MIQYENHLGMIDISQDFIVDLVGGTVTSCFGVAGMAVTGTQKGLLGLFHSKDALDKGVKVRVVGEELIIDFHIIVLYGTNISAIVKSIMNKVTYCVEEITGLRVAKVNVFIDGMKGE